MLNTTKNHLFNFKLNRWFSVEFTNRTDAAKIIYGISNNGI